MAVSGSREVGRRRFFAGALPESIPGMVRVSCVVASVCKRHGVLPPGEGLENGYGPAGLFVGPVGRCGSDRPLRSVYRLSIGTVPTMGRSDDA